MANYGYEPRTPLNLLEPPIHSPLAADSTLLLNKLYSIHDLVVEQLKIAKELQKHYADQRRTAKEFEVGDYVLLSTQNLKLLDQPSKKFKARFIGPFQIIKRVSPVAYELKLDSHMRVHPVFHISLLREYHSVSPETDTPDTVPSTNDYVYGDDFYHVKAIIDHKVAPFPQLYRKGPALLFRVRWEGYTAADDSWEPYVNLKRTDEFHSYLRTSDKLRLFLNSDEYLRLSRAYPSRFPRVLRD